MIFLPLPEQLSAKFKDYSISKMISTGNKILYSQLKMAVSHEKGSEMQCLVEYFPDKSVNFGKQYTLL